MLWLQMVLLESDAGEDEEEENGLDMVVVEAEVEEVNTSVFGRKNCFIRVLLRPYSFKC